MDRMVYIAMVGAQQTLRAQGVAANNLANANTTAFRGDLEAFTDLAVDGPGHGSRAYGIDRGQGIDTSAGSIVRTGNPLDVAIAGRGWFAVQAADGTEAYTRAGDLEVDASGTVTNGSGRPVLGNGGPIVLPPYDDIVIGSDGTISIRPLGAAPGTSVQIDRLRLVDPEPATLWKGEDGLIRTTADEAPEAEAGLRVVAGSLESSNVNAIDSMVRQIELARRFEMQMKAMTTARDNDQAADRLLRHGG